MAMYNIPTEGSNLEIMGFPFFIENVSPGEAFRRREYNFNGIVGGTQKVTPGAYVGLDFTITTHVPIDPERPDEHNAIFQEMMSKQVEVISPELGGRFNAIVVIKPNHDKLDHLKLDISIKEVPGSESLIPGEEFTVPASREVTVDEKKEDDKSDEKKTTSTLHEKINAFKNGETTSKNNGTSSRLQSILQSSNITSKVNSISKKSKGK